MSKPFVYISKIFENAHYLLLNKPFGVFSQPIDSTHTNPFKSYPILLEELRKQYPNYSKEWRLVHRLDNCVTGGILIAKNKTAASRFSKYLRKGGNYGYPIRRRYIAIVETCQANSKDIINTGIISTNGMITKYNFLGKNCVMLELVTGKKHQIRKHLSQQLGRPIINDIKYGAHRNLSMPINEIALHSAMIETRIGTQQHTHIIPIPEPSYDFNKHQNFYSPWSDYISNSKGSLNKHIINSLTSSWTSQSV